MRAYNDPILYAPHTATPIPEPVPMTVEINEASPQSFENKMLKQKHILPLQNQPIHQRLMSRPLILRSYKTASGQSSMHIHHREADLFTAPELCP